MAVVRDHQYQVMKIVLPVRAVRTCALAGWRPYRCRCLGGTRFDCPPDSERQLPGSP